MIAIYDNGRSYSDHSLHFVTVEDEAQAAKLLQLLHAGGEGSYSLVAVLEEVRWYEGRPSSLWGMTTYVDNSVVEREWGPRALAQQHRWTLADYEERGVGSKKANQWLLDEIARLEAL